MNQSSSVGAARLFWVTLSVSRPPLLIQVQIHTEADRPSVQASAPVQPAAALFLFFRLVPLIDASVHRTGPVTPSAVNQHISQPKYLVFTVLCIHLPNKQDTTRGYGSFGVVGKCLFSFASALFRQN